MISVIIPVYNVERYLKSCIESVLNQSFKDFEIILIDDGSTDNCPNICDFYAENYDNIYTIHKQNEGLGLTRNVGIDNSHGEYILFLDSDDTLDTDSLLYFSKYISEGFDTIISGYKRIDPSGNVTDIFTYNAMVYTEDDIRLHLIPMMIGSSPDKNDSIAVSACGNIYSKRIIKDNNIKFNSERKIISEDLIFNLDYLIHASKIKVLDQSLYNYRFIEGSLTKRYNKDRFKLIKELYYLEKQYLDSYSILDFTDVRLKKQFFIYLRMCFRQEDKRISKNSLQKCFFHIKTICSDPLVIEIIKNYPIHQLHLKQRIFIYLVKYQCVKLIYFCVKVGLIY